MKRFTSILLLTAFLCFAIAIPVSAGILSNTKEWVLDNALTSIIALIFIIIGGFFGGTAWGKIALKSKVPIGEAMDIYYAVRKARKSSSPGGKKVTEAEKDIIFKQVEEFVASIIKTFTGKPPIAF